MFTFVKNMLLAALLSISAFEIVASTDSRDPANFTERNVMDLGGAEFNSYKGSFADFLMRTEDGARFLQENFPTGFPATKSAFRDNNPVTRYKLWWKSLRSRVAKRERKGSR